MNKRTIGIVTAAAAAALLSYMVFQDVTGGPERAGFEDAAETALPAAADIEGNETVSGDAASGGSSAAESYGQNAADEKLVALEKMRKEAGKSGMSKLYLVKCSSCHGRDGKGPVGPSIAGKDAEYNMASLMKYKNGLVPNTLMKGILENTPEERLRELAVEISAFE